MKFPGRLVADLTLHLTVVGRLFLLWCKRRSGMCLASRHFVCMVGAWGCINISQSYSRYNSHSRYRLFSAEAKAGLKASRGDIYVSGRIGQDVLSSLRTFKGRTVMCMNTRQCRLRADLRGTFVGEKGGFDGHLSSQTLTSKR